LIDVAKDTLLPVLVADLFPQEIDDG